MEKKMEKEKNIMVIANHEIAFMASNTEEFLKKYSYDNEESIDSNICKEVHIKKTVTFTNFVNIIMVESYKKYNKKII